MNTSSESTRFLNGIKGIAALLVFAHHFCLAFIPAIHFGEVVPTYLRGIDYYLSDSWVSVLLNGNFLVFLFLMISFFLTTNKFIRLRNEGKDVSQTVIISVIKRYLTIAIPVFLISFIVYLILKVDGFRNIEVSQITHSPWLSEHYQNELTLLDLIKTSLWDVPFAGYNIFNTCFWMLNLIIWGNLIAIVFGLLINLKKEKSFLIIIFMVIISGMSSSYYLSVFLGILLSYLYFYFGKLKPNWLISIAMLFIGLVLGGYPTGVVPDNYYRVFSVLSRLSINISVVLHALGAFIVILSLLCLQDHLEFLNNKLFRYLGDISFSVYLIHIPVLFTIGMYLFQWSHDSINSYIIPVLISGMITLIIILILSWILSKIIAKVNVYIQKRISTFFLK